MLSVLINIYNSKNKLPKHFKIIKKTTTFLFISSEYYINI